MENTKNNIEDNGEKIFFNKKGHFVYQRKEKFKGYSLDALIREKKGKIETYIQIERKDMTANYHKEFVGNDLTAQKKATEYYNEIKNFYCK